MATINLLPRKEFTITLDSGTVIKGQYGTWALKRYCDKNKLTLKQVGERLSDPSLNDAIDYVLCAIEYSARKEGTPFSMTDVQLCDYIDELGGWQGEEFNKIFAHSADEDKGDDSDSGDEKKTEVT